MPRYVDLIALAPPSGLPLLAGQTEVPAQLQVWPPPADGRHEFGAGTYTVVLAVSAKDTNASFYEVQVRHDGHWWEARDIKNHLGVTSLKRLRRFR